MGIFDSIKNALGGDDDGDEGVKGPSLLLREAGIDPGNLNFSFGADGNVAVEGYVPDEATRARVEEIIGGMEQVSSVTNNLVVGAPPAPEPAPSSPSPAMQAETGRGLGAALESETAPEPPPPPVPGTATAPAEAAAGGATYTVQSGDTLWKIAEAQLGSGPRYTEIFEANRDILDNPDLIKPGQVLKIP